MKDTVRPTVHVLLPIHNRIDGTLRFVDCLVRQTFERVHLVLIDDGSTDGSADAVRERMGTRPLTVLTGDGSWWWAGALQEGLDRLLRSGVRATDYVLFINADTEFDPSFIEKGVRLIEAQDSRMLLLARCYDRRSGEYLPRKFGHFELSRCSARDALSDEDINIATTCGLLGRWDAVMRIGPFYRKILPHYGSDSEYTHRAYRRGLRYFTSDQWRLVLDTGTTGIGNPDFERGSQPLSEYFSLRNRDNPVYLTVLFLLMAGPWHAWRRCAADWNRSAMVFGRVLLRRLALPALSSTDS